MTEGQNPKLVEELIVDADIAPEPGTFQQGKGVMVEGEEVAGTAMTAGELTSAGWVYVYDTRTRERSLCNRNALPDVLRWTRPDGSRVYTTVKPAEPPLRGNHLCWLHSSRPERKLYDLQRLPVCSKANLANPYEARRHMEKRHPTAFKVIMEMRQEQMRQMQEQQLKVQQGLLDEMVRQRVATSPVEHGPEVKQEAAPEPDLPLYVSDRDKKPKKR